MVHVVPKINANAETSMSKMMFLPVFVQKLWWPQEDSILPRIWRDKGGGEICI